MKILYDHQIFIAQRYGGISRVFIELMRSYQNDPEIEFIFSKFGLNNDMLNQCSDFGWGSDSKIVRYFNIKTMWAVWILFRLYLKISKHRSMSNLHNEFMLNVIRKGDYDVFHPTYFDAYYLEYINKPFVITIHDMVYEIFYDLLPKEHSDEIINNKIILAEKASKIIAVSHKTKADILKYYKNVDSNKIIVVHNGATNTLEKCKTRINVNVPDKYLLFVGNRNYYKNYLGLLNGIHNLLKDDNGLFLVCAGGGGFSDQEVEYMDKFNIIDKIILVPSVNDEMLSFLYKNAIAFVFPSLYEGFGFPILEAFECGCPAILSDTSCFPEIAGNAAEYFDPYNPDSILDAIKCILKDEERRREMKYKGLERVKQFTWEKTAEKTKQVYKSVCNI